ncbi:MAG: ABC transporter permease [Bdellovibrionota bacterium]
MTLLKLSLKSLINRKVTTILTILSITISVTLLLSLERIRLGARDSFKNTISQTDLIVGARSSPLQLLLYSVFRIGDPTNNVSWASYQFFKNHKETKWTIPISLGDSHKGYRVVGTDQSYFDNYKFSGGKSLEISEGKKFEELFDVVLGYDVAQKLKYKIKDKIVLAHGSGAATFQDHANMPFKVVGILNKTGTPVDQSVHVSLEAIEAIHLGWETGAPSRDGPTADDLLNKKLKPTQITAFFMALESRSGVLNIQREINDYREEPLTAALPGVVLSSLWQTLSFVENILKLLTTLVFLTSLLSLFLVLLTSLKERRREMSILRSMGAKPHFIFLLFVFESCSVTILGIFSGIIVTFGTLLIAGPMLTDKFGLILDLAQWTANDVTYLSMMFGAAFVVGIIPAFLAYRNSLSDGLTIKV